MSTGNVSDPKYVFWGNIVDFVFFKRLGINRVKRDAYFYSMGVVSAVWPTKVSLVRKRNEYNL